MTRKKIEASQWDQAVSLIRQADYVKTQVETHLKLLYSFEKRVLVDSGVRPYLQALQEAINKLVSVIEYCKRRLRQFKPRDDFSKKTRNEVK